MSGLGGGCDLAMNVRPLTIKNARIYTGYGLDVEWRDLYTAERVLAAPALDALEVDLAGHTIFPGLVNAHDHLELNHYPRTKFREVYNNAHEWGDDVNARLNESPFKELRAYPLEDRLFIGGLKNLLCGATTVAHHGPPHKYMFRPDFPVRVLEKYGWAHSLHFNTDAEVVRSYRSTPKDWPWFIHLAEGTDEVAAGEYQRLKALGCVGKNTVIVHGVGMTADDVDDAVKEVRGLVWCPSTNFYLVGKTTEFVRHSYSVTTWRHGSSVALGSDSRLTADGDLCAEIVCALPTAQCDGDCVVQALLNRASYILGSADRGHLNTSAWADFSVFSGNSSFVSGRAIISLIVRGGIPQIGDPDLMAKFPYVRTVEALLDGVPKAINLHLARRIARCSLQEPGLELGVIPKRRFFV